MAQGKGTQESIRREAASLNLDLEIPKQTPVDYSVDPLPSLAEGEGVTEPLGMFERGKLGLQVGSPTVNIVTGLMDEYKKEYDINFNIQDHPELLQGIGHEDYDYIMESVSYTDAEHKRQVLAEERMQMQRLMKDGAISGTAYAMIGGTVVDPIFWASLAVEGAGGLQAVSKAQRMARLAALSGGTAAFETSILAGTRATVDAEDVLYAGVTGTALGTAGGMIANKFLNTGDLAKAADAVQHNFSVTVSKQLDENLVAPPKATVKSEAVESIFGKYDPEGAAARAAELGVEDIAEEVGELGYKEAFKANVAEQIKNGTFKPDEITNSKTFKVLEKNPLMSDFVRLFKSGSNEVKYLASELLENAAGVGGRRKTAAVLKHVWERKYLESTMPVMRKSYTEFAKANGVKWISPSYWGKTRKQWNDALRLEIEKYRNAAARGTVYESNAPQYIQDAATAWRKGMKEVAELARDSGVKGFDEFKILDGYVPLHWNGKAIIKAKAAGTLGRYTKMLEKGYVRAGISEKDAATIAKAVFNRQMKKAVGIDTNPGALLARDSREFLREMLDMNGVSKAEQEALFGRIDTTLAEQGKSARAKGRVPIDLTVTDGDLTLFDIVNNDMPSIGSRYFTEMSGRSALARKGITNDGAWRAVKNTALQSAIDAGDENIDQLTKILDGAYNQFLGQPVGEGIHRGMRRLQELSMTSMLGMVGVPQMAESANVIAAHGLANLFKYAPDVRAYRKAIKAGTADKSLLSELQAHLGGMWDEHLYYRPEVRLDQAHGDTSGMFNVLDNVLAGSKEILGYMSGMNTIKNIQQQFTAIGQANKLVKMIQKGGTDKTILNRFRDVGWDEKTLAGIKKHIDDGTITFQDNGSLDRLNLHAWDAKLVEDFSIGMQRHSAQLIQFPMVGETAYWQHSTIGSMMTQFRSFSMLAIEKQTARNLRFSDTEAMSAFTYSLGLSSLLYMTKVHAVSVGKKDRKEYLEKKLNAAAIFNGALQWSGVFSITSEGVNAASAVGLLPADWGSGSVGRGGAASFSIDKQVPAVSTAISGIKLTSGLLESIAPFGEHEFGKQEINSFFASIPLGNIYPSLILKNVLQGTVDEED